MNNQEPRTKNQEHRNAAPTMPDDVVLSVRGVSKKFCRNLRRSMWYGIQDLSRNLVGRGTGAEVGSRMSEVGSRKSEVGSQMSDVSRQFSDLGPLTSDLCPPLSDLCPPTSDLRLPPLRKDEFWALRNISFDLKRGEVLGLSRLRKATAGQVGRNGCGKTTLLRLIAGIFPPDHGEIAITGRRICI